MPKKQAASPVSKGGDRQPKVWDENPEIHAMIERLRIWVEDYRG